MSILLLKEMAAIKAMDTCKQSVSY